MPNAPLDRSLAFVGAASKAQPVMARAMSAHRSACQEGRTQDVERHRMEALASLESYLDNVAAAFVEIRHG